jgi:hypothetical protein
MSLHLAVCPEELTPEELDGLAIIFCGQRALLPEEGRLWCVIFYSTQGGVCFGEEVAKEMVGSMGNYTCQ